MAEGVHLMSTRNINPAVLMSPHLLTTKSSKLQLPSQTSSIICSASSRKNHDLSLISKKSSKSPRRLITLSTSDGRWHGNWSSDYLVTLRDLQLEDLVEDERKDAKVSINLTVQKHASFGFSVDGRIMTSFTRKCSNCSSPYCREIDTGFNVWVLLSSRDDRNSQLPEIGGDPSVIYVKPGCQADLDSLIQDTIRLTTTVKDTCSESCEKSEPLIQYIGAQNTASMDKRWGRLLELKNANIQSKYL